MDGKKSEAPDAKNDLSGRRLAKLSLAALGVVFGDIGTSPLYAIRECFHGLIVLGAVFLVATGAEALYTDMGHFGKRPIRLTWIVLILPALVLNYFGQGALLLTKPEEAHHPFYALVPSWAMIPMVVLATLATII